MASARTRPRRRVFVRAQAIAQVQRRLQAHSWPRLQMSLIVALTGGFGLLSSFVLLQLGLDRMALRYPLALALAYGVFLLLVWVWLRWRSSDGADLPDPTGLVDFDLQGLGSGTPGRLPSVDLPAMKSGGGGDFGGGGASASFDGGAGLDLPVPVKDVGEAVGSVAEADEAAIPLLVIALVIGLAVASLYVVYIAPVFFAEVMVDGALSYAFYRHLRGDDPQHWLATAVKRSALPFLITALFLAAVGWAMSSYAPGARSIGEVVRRAAANAP
ncbi:hypothetical protein [Ideonella sp. A 288]|uniref:hypothetical protein n=1 Tax=Ideonella sp. A 288 TaxID=1962181 RepID=UPI001F401853|nr:hypothetical protein [Ideonella sp. A 288]